MDSNNWKTNPTFVPLQLRVNQAGELAARLIYTAQTPIVVRQHPHLRPLMAHMYDQEAEHFETFNRLIHKHRVRPTALYPLWATLATGLGWSTALMGREAAMACTEAVETEIGGHYNSQIREILEMITQWEADGYEVGTEFTELVTTLRRIRDDELEHLDHAVENDAQKAEPHWLLTGVIRAGCRGAIWVSERV
jgi:3-demethoxyubiquinol 3-hydroxylase